MTMEKEDENLVILSSLLRKLSLLSWLVVVFCLYILVLKKADQKQLLKIKQRKYTHTHRIRLN